MALTNVVLDAGPLLEYGLVLASEEQTRSLSERDLARRAREALTHARGAKRAKKLKSLFDSLRSAWTVTGVWSELSSCLHREVRGGSRLSEDEAELLKIRFWDGLQESALFQVPRRLSECSLPLRGVAVNDVARVGYTDAALIELACRLRRRRARDVVVITIESPEGAQARLAKKRGIAVRSLVNLLV